jgi:hypothetical protein
MNDCRIAIVCVVLAAALAGCKAEQDLGPEVSVGALYAVPNQDGTWGVSKVLAVDKAVLHVRNYANKFAEQPTEKQIDELTLGGPDHPDGAGVAHLPLSRDGFFANHPVLITIQPVTEEELEAYNVYLEAINKTRP